MPDDHDAAGEGPASTDLAEADKMAAALIAEIREKLTDEVSKRSDARERSASTFRDRQDLRLGDAFRAFREVLECCSMIDEIICHESHVATDLQKALLRHHQMARLAGEEVLCLVRSGFGFGASSRSRAIYECRVRADVIVLHDNHYQLARRWLDWRHVEEDADLRAENAARLANGETPISPTVLTASGARVAAMTADSAYGAAFSKPYGWAAPVLAGVHQFKRLEELADAETWRPWYKHDNHFVHLGSQASQLLRPRTIGGVRHALAGPSRIAIASPAGNSMTNISLISARLVTSCDADVAAVAVLAELCERVQAARQLFNSASERRHQILI